jgi:hypothetical protein
VTIAETVRRLLKMAPSEPLCDACLAYACATNAAEMKRVTNGIIRADPAFHPGRLCVGSLVTGPTIYYSFVSADQRSDVRGLDAVSLWGVGELGLMHFPGQQTQSGAMEVRRESPASVESKRVGPRRCPDSRPSYRKRWGSTAFRLTRLTAELFLQRPFANCRKSLRRFAVVRRQVERNFLMLVVPRAGALMARTRVQGAFPKTPMRWASIIRRGQRFRVRDHVFMLAASAVKRLAVDGHKFPCPSSVASVEGEDMGLIGLPQ